MYSVGIFSSISLAMTLCWLGIYSSVSMCKRLIPMWIHMQCTINCENFSGKISHSCVEFWSVHCDVHTNKTWPTVIAPSSHGSSLTVHNLFLLKWPSSSYVAVVVGVRCLLVLIVERDIHSWGGHPHINSLTRKISRYTVLVDLLLRILSQWTTKFIGFCKFPSFTHLSPW